MKTTHLKTCSSFVGHVDVNKSKEVIDKFILSCMHLDASIFEAYMEEDDVFEDMGKYKFLVELKHLFHKSLLKANDNIKVSITHEKCRAYRGGKPVLNFELRQGENKLPFTEFGFRIDTENGILKDIHRCRFYKKHHDWFWILKAPIGRYLVRKADFDVCQSPLLYCIWETSFLPR